MPLSKCFSDDDSDSEDDTDSSDEWDTRQIKPKKQVDRPREHSLPGGVKTERDMKPDTKPGGHSIFDCKVKIEVLGEEGESFNDHPDRHRKHQHPDVKTESAYDSDGRAEQGPSDMKMKKKQWKAYKNPASNMDSDSNFNDVPTINDSDFDSKSMIGEDGFKAKNKSSSGKKRPNDSALGDGKSKPSAKKKKYRKRGDKKEKKEKRPPPPCKPELDAATGKYFCPFEGGCDFKADKEYVEYNSNICI